MSKDPLAKVRSELGEFDVLLHDAFSEANLQCHERESGTLQSAGADLIAGTRLFWTILAFVIITLGSVLLISLSGILGLVFLVVGSAVTAVLWAILYCFEADVRKGRCSAAELWDPRATAFC
jgi:hypothetical protein